LIALTVTPPLLLLFLFKYLGFTLDTLGVGQEPREYLAFILGITLPAGISFYTFHTLSYSIDVIDGKEKPEPSFTTFATFIAAFPQLVAGPIIRFHQLRDQLHRISSSTEIGADFVTGLKFFSIGLFAKTIVADVISALNRVHFHLDANVSSADALFAIISYSFRIYYDFWAYSIMAIGLGKMLGLDLPKNFAEPYQSLNPREFWRRWHMTLSYWLRDYVYLRLGGNERYIRNIMIVFATVGLWHGAGWNFVLWGVYHGCLVILYHLSRDRWDRLPRILQVGLTFTLVTLGWPLFQFDLANYLALLGQLFSFSFEGTRFGAAHWAFIGAVAAFTFLTHEERWLYNSAPKPVIDWPVVHATLACAAIMLFNFRDTFIYFRF
jgi:alginate O-acetyltransferase complex protein AlgI